MAHRKTSLLLLSSFLSLACGRDPAGGDGTSDSSEAESASEADGTATESSGSEATSTDSADGSSTDTTGGDGDDTATTTDTTGGDGDTGTDTTTDTTGGDGDTGTDTTTDTTGGDGDTGTDTTTDTTGGDGDGGACLDDGVDCTDNADCCGGFCYESGFQMGATCQSSCIASFQDGQCDDDGDCCNDGVCEEVQGGFATQCVDGGTTTTDTGTDTGGCLGQGESCTDSSECCNMFCIPGGPNAGTCA
jgi:hypothetical protein